jgi:lipoprotein NlpI
MKKTIVFIAALLLAATATFAGMKVDEGSQRIKVFSTMTDRKGETAVLKGKVLSYSAKDEFDKDDLNGSAQDKTKATVRLYDLQGVNEGDTLYVINDKNLIVAMMKVRSVFPSVSFGTMLVGYGKFRLSSVGDRVVQMAEDENAKYSYIYKARGDYYDSTGEEGDAIREYKDALKVDRNNPDAHLALGLLYLKQGIDQFAMKEFQESYRFIGRMYDKGDRFMLLKNMAEIRYREVYESFLPENLKDKYRDEAKKYCRQALDIYPESEEINYYLGVFNYRNPNPDDKKAREYFMKVLDINPSNADALVSLAELYSKHDNMDKARMYVDKALEADSSNQRAQKVLKAIESRAQVK